MGLGVTTMASLANEFTKGLATELAIPHAALRAVIDVESSGSPFLPNPCQSPKGADISGFPVVQFEGHIFWQQLSRLGQPALKPQALLARNPDFRDIIYPNMDRKYTLKPQAEWDQLIKARGVHQVAADRSASWGAFQVMGFNAEAVGFAGVAEFVEAMKTIEGQARAFVGYLKKVPATISALKRLDFATFARHYNGPNYQKWGYDKKMETCYRQNVKKGIT
jgi:hypothetical protein